MLRDTLIVIDVQNGLNTAANYDQLVTAINHRIDAYHAAGRPILFIQLTDDELPYGSAAWQLEARLHRLENDQVMLKYHSDSFYHTGLETTLHGLGASTIEIAGLQTEYCIDTAIRVSHDLGFKPTIIHDLNSTFNSPILSASQIIAHHESIWNGTFAEVLQTPED